MSYSGNFALGALIAVLADVASKQPGAPTIFQEKLSCSREKYAKKLEELREKVGPKNN